MPPFRRRNSAADADGVEESPSGSAADTSQARALAEEAEAEAAEAEATATAARARARALRLRREAEETAEAEESGDQPESAAQDIGAGAPEDDAAEGDAATDLETDVETEVQEPDAETRRRRLPHPTWKGIAATVVVLCTVALLTASGYMVWTHRQAEKLQQQNAEYAAAARQSVVTLMSLDFNQAQEDVQRIIDTSTGQFRDDFEQQATDFVAVAQESQVVTDVTVNSTAVESMSDESAVVLVAASSRVTNSAGAEQEPRTWRLSVGLEREDGQIKMSKVEFVP